MCIPEDLQVGDHQFIAESLINTSCSRGYRWDIVVRTPYQGDQLAGRSWVGGIPSISDYPRNCLTHSVFHCVTWGPGQLWGVTRSHMFMASTYEAPAEFIPFPLLLSIKSTLSTLSWTEGPSGLGVLVPSSVPADKQGNKQINK